MIDTVYQHPNHMIIDLFRYLDSLNGTHNDGNTIISSNEEVIFKNYNSLREHLFTNQCVTIISHCCDIAIVNENYHEIMNQISQDLDTYDNFRFIFITSLPYCLPYTDSYSLPKHQRFKWIYFPEYNGIYWNLYSDIEPLYPRPVKKHFLSLNKRADLYRQILYYTFSANNWLEKSYFTYLGEDKFKGTLFSKDAVSNIDQIIERDKYKHLLTHTHQQFLNLPNDKLLSDYNNGFNIITEPDPTWSVDRGMYNESFCSIVIETDPSSQFINISEKTFRTISIKHPLILFAVPSTYKWLVELGIDYDIFFPDCMSWDNGTTPFNRLDNLIDFISKFEQTTLKELEFLTYELDEKLEHIRLQYKHLYNSINQAQDRIVREIAEVVTFLPLDQWRNHIP